MKKTTDQIVPLEWNEAKQLESLLNSAAKTGQALVVDPKQGVNQATGAELISPNENLNGSVRFGTHYRASHARSRRFSPPCHSACF